MSNIRILETLYHSYETTNPTTASEAGGATIGKKETIPMNKHTCNSHGDRAYVSPDLHAMWLGILFIPLAVTLLCIAAQGHYNTPLVQQ